MDFDAIFERMEATRPRPGHRCHTCARTTPELRAFVSEAKRRGFSDELISRTLKEEWGVDVGPTSIGGHFRSGHDAR